MSEVAGQKVMKRGWVVVGAVLIQLCLGAIYAWSVFTPFLVPQQPKKDKKTGMYLERVLFFEQDGVRVGVVTPKNPKLKPNEKLVRIKAMESVEGDVPKGYPYDKSELKPVEADVVALKDVPEGKNPFHMVLHFSASKAKWTKTQSQVVFSVGLAVFAVVWLWRAG